MTIRTPPRSSQRIAAAIFCFVRSNRRRNARGAEGSCRARVDDGVGWFLPAGAVLGVTRTLQIAEGLVDLGQDVGIGFLGAGVLEDTAPFR